MMSTSDKRTLVPVTKEVKGTLARLLATENLTVEHRRVSTASFDVNNRVLVLPIWDASETVYDLLVGHEVGYGIKISLELLKKILISYH